MLQISVYPELSPDANSLTLTGIAMPQDDLEFRSGWVTRRIRCGRPQDLKLTLAEVALVNVAGAVGAVMVKTAARRGVTSPAYCDLK